MGGDHILVKRQIRLGITGASTSGKSTIVQAIQAQRKCSIISGDSFYIPESQIPTVDLFGKPAVNWDDPGAINWEQFYQAIMSDQSELILVDSYQLFYNPKITEILDAAIILEYEKDTDFKTALSRRIFRFSNQPVPEDFLEHPHASATHFEAAFFHNYVWKIAFDDRQYWDLPEFKRPVLRLSATNTISSNLSQAIQFIEGFQEKEE